MKCRDQGLSKFAWQHNYYEHVFVMMPVSRGPMITSLPIRSNGRSEKAATDENQVL